METIGFNVVIQSSHDGVSGADEGGLQFVVRWAVAQGGQNGLPSGELGSVQRVGGSLLDDILGVSVETKGKYY